MWGRWERRTACPVEHPRKRRLDPRHAARVEGGPAQPLVLQRPVGDLVVVRLVDEDALLVPLALEDVRARRRHGGRVLADRGQPAPQAPRAPALLALRRGLLGGRALLSVAALGGGRVGRAGAVRPRRAHELLFGR